MKKTLLVFGLAIAGLAANAQSEFKPKKGDVTTEFGLSGGVLNSSFNLNETGSLLRFRYFTQEKLAIRLGFNLSTDSETANAYGIDNSYSGNVKRKETSFLLNLGIEKHFTGTERLSTYVGGDILFGYGNQKASYLNSNNNLANPTYVANVSGEVNGPSTLGIGLRAVAGADYYFTKRVYLGVEGGFGFLYQSEGKTTITNNTASTSTTSTFNSAGNSLSVEPSVITGVRIGFIF